jgi:predicted nucleic acid-binding protein
MSAAEIFFDTSSVLYLLSADTRKADTIEALLETGGTLSVQVLNEFAAVARRKPALAWPEVREALRAVRAACSTLPVTEEIHDRGLDIAERYGFSLYDSMIVAAALCAGCTTLLTEDLQHRQLIDGVLRVRNPFVAVG